MTTAAEPLDVDVKRYMTKWGVEVQPIVTINGEVVYGLQERQEECFHHTPLSERWEENGSPTWIGYGGAAGAAKSHTARAIASRVALQWPGSNSIIFRRTLGEVEENHVEKFREELPPGLCDYTGGRKMLLRWPNGSRTFFGYLRTDQDKFRYQGNEYDFMAFEEATHYPYETVNWLISNRLRATVEGSIPFALFPSNPGNIGHFWFKRLFIDKRYDPDRAEEPENYAFIQAFLTDNHILMARDPGYIKKLSMLPEPWKSWLRDGDFAAGAGLFFHELDRREHLIEPFDVPDHWPKFGGFDWGFQHPWAFGVYASDEDGTIYKLATFHGRRESHDQLIASIFDQAKAAKIDLMDLSYVASGLDTFARKGKELGYDGPTLSEKMIEAGLVPIEANTGRVHGATNLREYIHWEYDDDADLYVPPGFFLFKNPGNVVCFDCLESRVSDDERNVEDVLKTNANDFGEGGDDDYDETRYALASRPSWASSIGLDREVHAWDPDVLEYEAKQLRRSFDVPPGTKRDRPGGI